MSEKPQEPKKQKLTQGTLVFNSSSLRIGGAAEQSQLQKAMKAAEMAEAAAVAAAESAQTAATVSKKAPISEPPTFFDPERPVMVSFAPGFGVIKVKVSTRRPATVEVKAKRAVYTPKQKKTALQQVSGLSQADAAKRLRTVSGYEKITGKQIREWRKAAGAQGGPAKKHGGGPKVNSEFESAVLDQLVYTELEDVDGKAEAVVKANVAYSHAMIVRAATHVQKLPQFASDAKVQNLKFKPPWVMGWLRRNALRRRRITAADKVLPEPPVVQKRMEEIQTEITDGGYTEEETASADETGIFFGAQPKKQYIPPDAERATAPETDDKARFTELLWSTVKEVGPAWAIIKCSVKGHDLSSVRVLKTLHEQEGFTAADGWELKMWEKTLTLLDSKKKEYTAHCKRPYLINTQTLEVITVQIKAWMDTTGMCMWAEVQLKPWMARRTGRLFIVWDNCGPHKVPAVKAVFEACNIKTAELPPKMTDILQECSPSAHQPAAAPHSPREIVQVMDLIFNGPVKNGIRRARCDDLYDFFQNWKIKRLEAQVNKQPLPKFQPPKPKVADGLRVVQKVCKESFTTSDFLKSLHACFVGVGLAKDPTTGEYKKYTTHRRGTLAIKKVDAGEETATFGEIATELEMVPRDGAESDDEGEGQQPEEEEGEGEDDEDEDE